MARAEDLTGIGMGTGPAMRAGGDNLGPDHVAPGGTSRGVDASSTRTAELRPQDWYCLANGVSTAPSRQTLRCPAVLAPGSILDSAMTPEHPGSLGCRRPWGQPRRRPGHPTRPAVAPAWWRLGIGRRTPCHTWTPATGTDTTAMLAPTRTLTSAGRRLGGDGAVDVRRLPPVMAPVMRTRRPTGRLAPTSRPANAEVLTAPAYQRPGAPRAGLWAGSSLMGVAPPLADGSPPSEGRCRCGGGACHPNRPRTVGVGVDRAGHALRPLAGCLLRDEASVAAGCHGRRARRQPPRRRQRVQGTGTGPGCGWPDRDAPADHLPHVDVGETPTAPAPDRADVSGRAGGTDVAAAAQPPG
jgi:hypothetical protein